jgi:PAS domain S-box-containing protein/putative nucleotidyltransferase with HDIG domain
MKKELPIEEQHFRVFVENSPDIIVLINLEGIITYINPAVEKVLGFKPEERIGAKGFELVHPDDIKFLADSFNTLIRDTNYPVIKGEMRLHHKDGSWRTLEAVGRNLVKNNVVEAIIVNYRDISERKQAEEALCRSEEKYRTILENIEEGYFEVDLAGNYTFVNDSMCRIHGYPRKELIGMNSRQYTNKEFAKKIYKAFNGVYKTGKSTKEVDWQVVRKDGTKIYIESSISLQKDSSGKPTGFRGITRDITKRKEMEEKLRESEASYRQLFDNSPAAIYRVDFKSGRFLKANDVFCKYFGCRQEEITSLSPYDILTEDSKKLFLERMGKMALGVEVPNIVEYEVVDKKGKRWFLQLNNKDIYDTEGHVVAADVVAHDITERKKAEVKLQHTLDSLRKAHGATIQVMISAVEMRDPYTSGHQIRSADLARAIATEMGLSYDKVDGIRLAGSIHDIGKLSVPAEILSKPTKLTDLEFSLIKEHAQVGYEMLKNVESPWPLAQIVYQHHERMNGSGYPRNLKGNEILIEARIMAVADVVESMASHRPYRPARGIEAAMEEIEKNKGILYDDAVADACLRLLREKSYQLK